MRTKSICEIEGCYRGVVGKGLCGKHYQRMRKYGNPETVFRINKLQVEDRICEIIGCGRKSYVYRLCQTHYKRNQNGDPQFDREIKVRGNGYIDDYGYHLVVCPSEFNVMAKSDGMVPEHRLVMAQYLNRSLLPFPEETVHHINGDKLDNHISNLQLRISSHGSGQAYQCLDCGSCNVISVPI